MAHFLIEKRPAEVLSYAVYFSDLLGPSDTQLDTAKTTAALRVTNTAGEDKKSYLIRSLTFSTTTVTLVLQNGIDGEDYVITVIGVGNTNFDTYQPARVIELRVRATLCGNV